jgi:tetratricopeptide (TPR) repeat protein
LAELILSSSTQEKSRFGKDTQFSVPSSRFSVPERALSERLAARVLESNSPAEDSCFMADNPRQKAEDHYYAALDLVSEGRQELALEEYRTSLDADPTFTEAMHGMARALQDLNRLDEAIAVAKRIGELDPDDVLAHTSLSVLYQKKGMIPEAEAEGNKARVLGWKQQLKKS